MRRPNYTYRNHWRTVAIGALTALPLTGLLGYAGGTVYGRYLEYKRTSGTAAENMCLGNEFRKLADMVDYNAGLNPTLFTQLVFPSFDETRCIVRRTHDRKVKTIKVTAPAAR
jgi:hypothetical protein